jgi:hypothetical protein
MKNQSAVLVALFSLFLLANIQETNAQSIWEKWPELNQFHKVMSETFHPMEEGDFAPIRARAGEMKTSAQKLFKSEIPAEFNTPEIESAVMRLRSGTKTLLTSIKAKANDNEIESQLTNLHDVFHEIVGLCQDKGEKHHDHNHQHKND